MIRALVRLIFLNGEPVMLLRLLQQTHPQPRRCRALCQGAQMGGLPRVIAIAFDAGYDRARLSMADWMAVPRCHCFAF